MKLNGKELLTAKQAAAVKSIKRRCKTAGIAVPTPQIVAAAHAETYDIATTDPVEAYHAARTIGAANMKKPAFQAALGFDCQEMRQLVGDEILRNIRGESIFGRDRDIYRDSLKLAARYCWPETIKYINESEDLAKRTTEELQFFIAHGRWPNEPDALAGFASEKDTGKPQ